MKKLKESEIRDLLDQVKREEITFSRFVEIINGDQTGVIQKIDRPWVDWLKQVNNGLTEDTLSEAVGDLNNKLNEVIDLLNKKAVNPFTEGMRVGYYNGRNLTNEGVVTAVKDGSIGVKWDHYNDTFTYFEPDYYSIKPL